MKKNLLAFIMLLAGSLYAVSYAQRAYTGHRVNSVKGLVKELTKKDHESDVILSMQLSSTESIDVKILEDQSEGREIKVYGEVQGVKTSIFYIYGNADDVKGHIVIDGKEGYELSTDIFSKDVVIRKADIHKLICVTPGSNNVTSNLTGAQTASENIRTSAQPAYSSFPSAPFVLYLDFDGENVNDSYWNSQMGGAKNCTGPNFSDAKIQSIWAGVAEKYRPWNINVTTDRTMFDAKTAAMRHMVIYTMTWQISGSGGIANIGSIANNGTDICWVFYGNLVNDVNDMVITAAHESGHAFGLEHDGCNCGSNHNYYSGQGNWGPIMGSNYQTNSVRSVWQWSKGEYNNAQAHGGAPNVQDDVALIAGNPGVGYRTDDHGDNTSAATAIIAESDGTVLGTKNKGVITKRTDVDYFKFIAGAGNVTFNFQSGTRNWTDDEGVLDIQARLLDAAGNELAISNPTIQTSGPNNGLDATLTKSVTAGTYYLEVDGAGYLDPKTTGYSDYASLGYYEISGSFPQSSTGIEEWTAGEKVIVYPNPNNGKFIVSVNLQQSEDAELRIMNLLGEVIYQEKIGKETRYNKNINLTGSAEGIYLVQVKTTEETISEKIMLK